MKMDVQGANSEDRMDCLVEELVKTTDYNKLPKKYRDFCKSGNDLHDMAMDIIFLHTYENHSEELLMDDWMKLFPHADRGQCELIIREYVAENKIMEE